VYFEHFTWIPVSVNLCVLCEIYVYTLQTETFIQITLLNSDLGLLYLRKTTERNTEQSI